jgi:hypothetical protein
MCIYVHYRVHTGHHVTTNPRIVKYIDEMQDLTEPEYNLSMLSSSKQRRMCDRTIRSFDKLRMLRVLASCSSRLSCYDEVFRGTTAHIARTTPLTLPG